MQLKRRVCPEITTIQLHRTVSACPIMKCCCSLGYGANFPSTPLPGPAVNCCFRLRLGTLDSCSTFCRIIFVLVSFGKLHRRRSCCCGDVNYVSSQHTYSLSPCSVTVMADDNARKDESDADRAASQKKALHHVIQS